MIFLAHKFVSEYAVSGYSKCRYCRNNIEKDELRLSAKVFSEDIGFRIDHWYHFNCFPKRYAPQSVTEIERFSALRYEDQVRVRDLVKKTTGFVAEYALSNKSQCRLCAGFIAIDSVRIAKLESESDLAKEKVQVPRWFHKECFIFAKDDLDFCFNASEIIGFDDLTEKDRYSLDHSTIGKRKSIDYFDDCCLEKSAKRLKIEDDCEIQMQQSDKLCEFIKQLKQMSANELQYFLHFNKLNIPKWKKAYEHELLADCMLFGVPNKCPACTRGTLLFDNIHYRCTSYKSTNVRCMYICKQPDYRSEIKIPSDLKSKYSFLNEYVFKNGMKRIIDENMMSCTSLIQIDKSVFFKNVDRGYLPLSGQRVGLIGDSINKIQVMQVLNDLGGSLTSEIDRTVLFIISNLNEIEKSENEQKVKLAKELNIAIVDESIISDLSSSDAFFIPSMVQKYLIVKWNGDIVAKYDNLRNKKRLRLFANPISFHQRKTQMLNIISETAVDPNSGLKDRARVVILNDVKYSVVLSLFNIVDNWNNFYVLQALEEINYADENNKKYWLYRSWGRVGVCGSHRPPIQYNDVNELIKAFENKYYEKTFNYYRRPNFVKHPGKYSPVNVSYTKNKNFQIQKPISSLSVEVHDLITMLFDTERMKNDLLKFNLDLEKLPLGKIKESTIIKASNLLMEIERFIKNEKIDNLKFYHITSKYYQLIPHNFGIERPSLIDKKKLNKEFELIDSLWQIENAYQMLCASKNGDVTMNCYENLKCEINVLSKCSEEYKIIADYVKNTQTANSKYKLELLEVFTLKRDEDEKRFKKDLGNCMLLWHGSRIINFAGILSQGLRIAPPEATLTGARFGKGIYFSDMVSKAAYYCHANHEDNIGLLLLNEVALSEMLQLKEPEYIKKLPDGKSSVKGMGVAAPSPWKTVDLDGVKVPIGEPKIVSDVAVEGSKLRYNQYVVYDVCQVKMRYLVKVKFVLRN